MVDTRLIAAALTVVALSPPPWLDAQRPTASRAPDTVTHAQLSADGRTVAFTKRAIQEGRAAPHVRTNLWRISFAGDDLRQLTFDDTEYFSPRWSPDGRRIALLSRPTSSDRPARIAVLGSEGGAIETVTPPDINVSAFEWSPDGTRIAYLPSEQSRSGLWIADLPKRVSASLRSLSGMNVAAFSWRRDGRSIAALLETTPPRIVLASVSGVQRPTAITTIEAHQLSNLAWSGDGRYLGWLEDPGEGERRRVRVWSTDLRTRDLLMRSDGTPLSLAAAGRDKFSVVLSTGSATWLDLMTATGGERVTVMPSGIGLILSTPSWSADGMRYCIVAESAEHGPEVFVGTLPPRISQRSDTVGAPPPPVRRLTFASGER